MTRRTPWYPRLGDVPGVVYVSPGIDRRTLAGHDARPVVIDEFKVGDERLQVIEWQWPDGASRSSPARDHGLSADEPHSPAEWIQNLREALELPGELSDYHFAIAGAAATLWNARREHPEHIETAEELWWLDVALVEAHPETVEYQRDGGRAYYSLPAFANLATVYEQQGFIHEALDVTERAWRFGQLEVARERLHAKLERLQAETDG